MPAYHQMGHHSENIVKDSRLDMFGGAILSPVNSSEGRMSELVQSMADHPGFEFVFDPQLYYPATERGLLRDWTYFPSDVDSADLQNRAWWSGLNESIAESALRVGANAVCSPVVVPRAFTDEYYDLAIRTGSDLIGSAGGLRVYQTLLVSMTELASRQPPEAVASMVTAGSTRQVILVPISSIEPRREYSDPGELRSLMRLISLLEGADVEVLVAFCSTDIVLWKAAGASSCASGKFFNLRRFTPSRFEEPSDGGGQLPYWTDERLLGFLRESDVLRLIQGGRLDPDSVSNPFGRTILKMLLVDRPRVTRRMGQASLLCAL